MRHLGILLVASAFSSVDAYAQEYIQQQTKAQCDARGGRITQWMSSIGVYPEVGTCFVPPARTESGGDSTRSCAAFDRVWEQYQSLPDVPDNAAPARHCSHYRQVARLLEQSLQYLPCEDYTSGYPNKVRQWILESRDTAAEWCAKAERADAAPPSAAVQSRPSVFPKPAITEDPTLRPDYVGPNVTVVTKESAKLGSNAEAVPEPASPRPNIASERTAALPSWVPASQDPYSPPSKQEVVNDHATVKNCVSLKQVGKLDFRATNECPFAVRIKVKSMNFDHSISTDKTFLSGSGGYTNISSYWEVPTISGAD